MKAENAGDVPLGAVMDNVNGSNRIKAKLDLGLEVGSGVRAEDMEHFKSRFGSDITNVIPASWKFSTFYNNFMTNKVDVSKIASFSEHLKVRATEYDSDDSYTPSISGEKLDPPVGQDVNVKKPPKGKTNKDTTTPRPKRDKDEAIEIAYKNGVYKKMVESLSGEQLFGIENSKTVELYSYLLKNKMIKSITLNKDLVQSELLFCSGVETMKVHQPWHVSFYSAQVRKSTSTRKKAPKTDEPENKFSGLRRRILDKQQVLVVDEAESKKLEATQKQGNGDKLETLLSTMKKQGIREDMHDDESDRSNTESNPAAEKNDGRLLLRPQDSNHSLVAQVSNDSENHPKRKRAESSENVDPPALKSHKSSELDNKAGASKEQDSGDTTDSELQGMETSAATTELLKDVREEVKRADSDCEKLKHKAELDHVLRIATKIASRNETLVGTLQEAIDLLQSHEGPPELVRLITNCLVKQAQDMAVNDTIKEKLKAGKPPPSWEELRQIAESIKAAIEENEATAGLANGRGEGNHEGIKDAAMAESPPKNGNDIAPPDAELAAAVRIGAWFRFCMKKRRTKKTDESRKPEEGMVAGAGDESNPDAVEAPPAAPHDSYGSDGNISSDAGTDDEKPTHLRIKGKAINGMGIKPERENKRQLVYVPNKTAKKCVDMALKQKKFKGKYATWLDEDMELPFLYVFDTKAQADTVKQKWGASGLDTAEVKVIWEGLIEKNPEVDTYKLFDLEDEN